MKANIFMIIVSLWIVLEILTGYTTEAIVYVHDTYGFFAAFAALFALMCLALAYAIDAVRHDGGEL